MYNEAQSKHDDEFNTLVRTLRLLVNHHETIMGDDQRFNEFLIDAVQNGELKATHALYLYCSRHGINDFKLVNLRLKDGGPRTPVLDFFDALLDGQDISGLLDAIDGERLNGRI